MKMMYLHFSQTETILVDNYFALGQNANLFVHERLAYLLYRIYFCERKFLQEKNEKLEGREFLQLFVETLPNKLSPLPKKDNKQLPYIKAYVLIKVLVYLSFKS